MSFTTLAIEPNNVWDWSLPPWYLGDDLSTSPTALGEGNNLLTSSLFFRLDENWGLRTTHRFDVRNGRLQEQSYSIYRDLRIWIAAITFRLLDDLTGPDGFTRALTLA